MKLDRIARAKLDMIKVIRTNIRLKHALLADDECRDVLPDAIADFDRRVQQGKLKSPGELDTAKILLDVAAAIDARINGGR